MTSHTLQDTRGNKARFDMFSKINGGHVQIVYLDTTGRNFYTENKNTADARKMWSRLVNQDGYKVV
jgi:hypothetical protein